MNKLILWPAHDWYGDDMIYRKQNKIISFHRDEAKN